MLKKAVLWFILGVFTTPLFLQTWQGHAFGHALHEIYQPPVHDQNHDHHAHRHDDLSNSEHSPHHLLPNSVFYFSEFLHLDLQTAVSANTQISLDLHRTKDQDPPLWQRLAFLPLSSRPESCPLVHAQAPPLSQQSIYLKTQRLRL